ncbi:MAG: hypothetical protein IJ639_01765 [Ruminococcus sp.]|nr:hypothetical protein [Ruminococcus sp.]
MTYPLPTITGQESRDELLGIRRDRIREKRIRKASRLTGTILPVHAADAAVIIEFPESEFPRIA